VTSSGRPGGLPVPRRMANSADHNGSSRDRWSHLAGEVHGGRHRLAVRVYYEDTDFSGIVYHASYLRFMERGRTDYLRLIGADHRALFEAAKHEAPGFAFVVRSMTIDFLKPARMDDVLLITTQPVDVRGASIALAQQVERGDEVLVTARVRVAFVSDGRARPIPRPLRAALRADQETAPDVHPDAESPDVTG